MKSKISFGKGVNYLRELSVVVVGIAITLGIQNLMVSRQEQKDLKLYLNAVKMELETNLQTIDSETAYLEDWTGYARYLAAHEKKSLNPDSIRNFNYPEISQVSMVVFQTSAFEMFKISGLMRLMDDKELSQSIWGAYNRFETIKLLFEMYYQLKMEEMKKDPQLTNGGKKVDIPLYYFFVEYAAYFGLLEHCKEFSEILKKLTTNIDKTLK